MAATSFVVPVPSDTDVFSLHSHGVAGRCSYCLEPAATMTPGGVSGRLGKRRWLRDPATCAWWYLPPPEPNEPEHWWKLVYSFTGHARAPAGWHLRAATGDTTIDLCAEKLHRVRALVERYFAFRAPELSAAANGCVKR